MTYSATYRLIMDPFTWQEASLLGPDLRRLEIWNLHHDIKAEALQGLERLKNLDSLTLRVYGLYQSHIQAITRLTALTSLELEGLNQLSSASLEILTRLPLKELRLNRWIIPRPTHFEALAKFSHMQNLAFLGCSLSEFFWDALTPLTKLRELDLSDSDIKGNLGNLASCNSLTVLKINRALCEPSYNGLESLTGLKELHLEASRELNHAIIQKIAMLNLDRLNVAFCRGFDNSAAQTVMTMTALRALKVSFTAITGFALIGLSKLPELADLAINLDGTNLPPLSLTHLHHAPNLCFLTVCGEPEGTKEALDQLRAVKPYLVVCPTSLPRLENL